MDIIIDRAQAKRATAALTEVVPARTTIPVLECVVLSATAGRPLSFRATDMERWLDVEVPAEIVEGGDLAVPAQRLKAIADGLPEGAQLRLRRADNGRLLATSGRSRFSLPVLPVEDFPTPKPLAGDTHEIAAAPLRRLLDRCQMAMSTEETRFYLKGILLHGKRNDDGAMELVATSTDGHRLTHDRVSWDAAETVFRSQADGGLILPRFAVTAIGKLFADAKALDLRADEGRIEVATEGRRFVSKLIDGRFPDYCRVIPRRVLAPLVVPRADLEALLARLRPLAAREKGEKSVTMPVVIDILPDRLVVRAGSAETGYARDEMPIDWPGERITIGFNVGYLLDAIRALGGERLTLHFVDAASPLRIETDAAPEALAVVMPFRATIPDVEE